jgi:hypothetical protein
VGTVLIRWVSGCYTQTLFEGFRGFRMKRITETTNFRDYLRIGEAAALLGVTVRTLQNWDYSGKLKPLRHPVNGYRLYRAEDLESLLKNLRPRSSAATTKKHRGKV